MAVRVVTDSGRTLRLGARLDNGGEGVVYQVQESPGLVAKLLLRPRDPAATRQRLASLVRQGRPRRAAWPVATISTAEQDISGFLMPDMRLSFQPFDCLVAAGIRQERFPAATWATSLTAAASLARLVVDLHAERYVVGDMKRENLWVDAYGNIGISDVDSFQFTDGTDFYPCHSRSPGYTAPEGIGVSKPVIDECSDDFVLAVLIYQLLMAGMHPFYGQPADGSPYVSLDDNVRHGRTRLLRSDSVLVPRWVPPLSVLPRRLQDLFRQCFDDNGRQHGPSRPTARDWLISLDAARSAGRLRQCAVAASHVHTAERPWCPWCALASHGPDLYPPDSYSINPA